MPDALAAERAEAAGGPIAPTKRADSPSVITADDYPVVDWDPFSRLKTIYHPESDGKWRLEYVQDCEPDIEACKALQNAIDGWSPTKEWRWAAHIPDIIILKWMKEDGIDIMDKNHWPAVRRRLNDPEWRYLRTAPWNL